MYSRERNCEFYSIPYTPSLVPRPYLSVFQCCRKRSGSLGMRLIHSYTQRSRQCTFHVPQQENQLLLILRAQEASCHDTRTLHTYIYSHTYLESLSQLMDHFIIYIHNHATNQTRLQSTAIIINKHFFYGTKNTLW